jgi:hypothetical protein
VVESIRAEASGIGNNVELNIEARVFPALATTYGTISEPFVHTMTLGMNGDMLAVTGEAEKSQPGSLSGMTTTARPGIDSARSLALPAFGVTLLLAVGWFLFSRRAGQTPRGGNELLADAQRLTKGTVVLARALPPVANEEGVLHMDSLEDLARVAHELMRPVIATEDGEGYRFSVIEGANQLRYEYRFHPVPDVVISTRAPDEAGRRRKHTHPLDETVPFIALTPRAIAAARVASAASRLNGNCS